MAERRSSPRYTVQDVHGTLLLSTEARILNMSLTGMAVETDARLRLGRPYSLKVQHDGEAAVPLTATVMWCQLRQSRPGDSAAARAVYVAGLEFGDVLTEKAHDVMTFLRSAAIVSVQTRVCGRFRARFPDTINLNTEYQFEVEKISVSGMLIVTDLVAEPGSLFETEVQLDEGVFRSHGRVANVSSAPGRKGTAAVALGVEFTGMSETDRALLVAFIGNQLG